MSIASYAVQEVNCIFQVAGKDKLDSVRSSADNRVNDAEARARGLTDRTEEKLAEYRNTARDSLSRARDSTEQLYGEARSTADRKAAELREEAERKAEQAKEGWFSWLGWGKSKAQGAKETIENKTDQEKRYAAQKVADGAESARTRAEKHA